MEKQRYYINLEDKKQREKYAKAMLDNLINIAPIENTTQFTYHLNDCTVLIVKGTEYVPTKLYDPNKDQLYAQVQIFHENSLEKILKTKLLVEEKTGLKLEKESE
jgi:hypothetical protein